MNWLKLKKPFFIFALMLIFGTSFYFRFWNLGETSYWFDEMSSLHFATHPYWGALFWDNSPFLYNLLLKIWIFLFSDSETATRTFSALTSFATTILWARVGFLVWGHGGSLLASSLHSVFFISVYLGRETRMYALFELMTTAVFMQFLLEEHGRKLQPFLFYINLVILGLSHFLSVIPLSLGAMWSFVRQKKFSPAFNFICIFGLVISTLFYIQSRAWPLTWMKVLYDADHPLSRPWDMLSVIFAGPAGMVSFAVLGILSISRKNRVAVACLVGVLSSLLIAWIGSSFLKMAVFHYRYFIFLTPWLIYIGTSAIFVHSKNLQKVAIVIFLGFLVVQLQGAERALKRQNPPWSQAAKLAGNLGATEVFTTRPLSIQTPYFEKYSIKLQRLEGGSGGPFHSLDKSISAGQRFLIIENIIGYSFYREAFEKFLKEGQCQSIKHSVPEDRSNEILILEIDCPP